MLARRSRGPASLLPVLVTVLLLWPTLWVGYLSDDFLFLAWSRQDVLLSKLSLGSYPQVLRPLAAVLWALPAAVPAGVRHALCILLHAANATLVSELVGISGQKRLGVLLGCLFAAAPWTLEATAWVSGAVDPLATLFCLLALRGLIAHGKRWIGWTIVLYLLALLCKESAFTLPVVAWILIGRRARGAVVGMGVVGAVYVGVRLILFQGVGGYATGDLPTVLSYAESVAVLLVPFKSALPASVGLAVVSTGLLTLAAEPLRRPRNYRWWLRVLLAFVAAVLPVLPVLAVGWDHQGGRFLYLPLAVGLVAFGLVRPQGGSTAAPSLFVLLALWSAATVYHVQDWVAAGRIAGATLDAVAGSQALAGSTLLVAVPETFRGAYVFRNGLAEAAAMSSRIERRSRVVRGIAAAEGPSAGDRLGSSLFVVQPILNASGVDLTAFEIALRSDPPADDELADLGMADRFTANVAAPPGFPPVVWLHAVGCRGGGESVDGTLYWRGDGGGLSTTQAREFDLVPGAEAVPVWLPSCHQPRTLSIRIDLDRTCTLKMTRTTPRLLRRLPPPETAEIYDDCRGLWRWSVGGWG